MKTYAVTVTRYFKADNSVDAVYQYFNTLDAIKKEWADRDKSLNGMPEIEVRILWQNKPEV